MRTANSGTRSFGGALLLAALAAAFPAGCGGSQADVLADTLARERAASLFGEHKDLARQAIAPLVARRNASVQDLVTAAAIEFADGKQKECAAFLDRATRVDPKSAAVPYLRGQLARFNGDYQAALPLFRIAREIAPNDLPSKLCLAEAQAETGDEKSAEALYRSVVDVGLENGQTWYLIAVYRLQRLLSISHRESEAEPLLRLWGEYEKAGVRIADTTTVLMLGELAKVRPPRPTGSGVPKPTGGPEFAPPRIVLPEFAGASELLALDVDGDVKPDLEAVTAKGVLVAFSRESGFDVKTAVEGPVELARWFDVDNDADLDLIVWQSGKPALYLLDKDKESWTRSPLVLPELPSPPRDVVPVDFDHDGDLDLVLVGDFGARVWRNDAATTPGEGHGFVDASEKANFPAGRAFDWAIAEDFDGDNDVDFLFGGRSGLYLADSLRESRFADKTRVFPAGTSIGKRPIVADFDGDARPDLWTPSGLWHQENDGSFRLVPRAQALSGEAWNAQAVDLDLDGSLDLVWTEGASIRALLSAGTPEETAVSIDPAGSAPTGPIAAADLDWSRTVDLALATAGGVAIRDGKASENRGVRLSYRGARSNRRAVGSIVEYRAGPVYRRTYWRGEPVLAGVGKATKVDVLRITWTNGIVQSDVDVDLRPQGGVDDPNAAFKAITEASALGGSCPFLYARSPAGTVLVSDVLGGTPLGLPAKPGVLVPFRHEEYVLVKGSELAPVDGFLDMHVTEELREVTYLDAARLEAVDHPAGTSVFPNERFCFPPFPEAHLHTVESPLAPVRATGSDGKDWTAALADADGAVAEPFTLEAEQYAGHAKPWFLDLAFDPAKIAGAAKLRLVMDGWLYWSDSTANVASAGAGLEFVPPTLEVPDGAGGWKSTGPPVGFPSGKTKTMVIDVTSILPREDPRIRIRSTLRLYWDSIRLAVDGDDAPKEEREVPLLSANLWRRGFSAPAPESGLGRRDDARPERFAWDRLIDLPRWNQSPGTYTRYGECRELLGEVDDRYAMIGAGDALTLRFDGRELPPPKEGFVRDWIVHLDGWCKDADLNTVAAESVGPLPFHAMSAYPYPDSERFPDDEAHAAWRKGWLTRPAYRWIPPLSPKREAEQLNGR
jgi:hypothetical protein